MQHISGRSTHPNAISLSPHVYVLAKTAPPSVLGKRKRSDTDGNEYKKMQPARKRRDIFDRDSFRQNVAAVAKIVRAEGRPLPRPAKRQKPQKVKKSVKFAEGTDFSKVQTKKKVKKVKETPMWVKLMNGEGVMSGGVLVGAWNRSEEAKEEEEKEEAEDTMLVDNPNAEPPKEDSPEDDETVRLMDAIYSAKRKSRVARDRHSKMLKDIALGRKPKENGVPLEPEQMAPNVRRVSRRVMFLQAKLKASQNRELEAYEQLRVLKQENEALKEKAEPRISASVYEDFLESSYC